MKNNAQLYDIVFLGHYTKDTIVSSSGTRIFDGGAFNYGAAVTSLKMEAEGPFQRNIKEVNNLIQSEYRR